MTVFATYILALGSPLRVNRLLWEQEIGSSNLSTTTIEKYQTSLNKALSSDGAFCFHSLPYLSNIYQIKDTKMKDIPIGVWHFKNEGKSSFLLKYLKRKSEVFCLWENIVRIKLCSRQSNDLMNLSSKIKKIGFGNTIKIKEGLKKII